MSASGSSLGGITAAALSGSAAPPALTSGASSATSWLPAVERPGADEDDGADQEGGADDEPASGSPRGARSGHRGCTGTDRRGRECGWGGGPDEWWSRRQVAPALVLALVAGEGIVHVSGPPDRVRSHAGRTDAGPASDPEARRRAITWAFGRCKDDLKSALRRRRPPSTAGRPSPGDRPSGDRRPHRAARSGSHTTKLAPCPGTEATLTVPPCASAIWRTRASPRPCPSPSAVGAPSRQARRKTRACSSGAMPGPTSRTPNHSHPPARPAREWTTEPAGATRSAFETRFAWARFSADRSPSTSRPDGASHDSRTPRVEASASYSWATSATTSARSTGTASLRLGTGPCRTP